MEKCIKFEGVVVQSRGKGNFLVKIDDTDTMVSCVLSGNIRKNSIKIIEGDCVDVEVSPYDLTKGRIIYRKKANFKKDVI